MNPDDISELIFVSGALFFVAGYVFHDILAALLQKLKRAVLAPAYLKKAGVLYRRSNGAK